MRNDEVQSAIKTLIELGVLIKYDDSLKLYHGRAGVKGDNWQVDPTYNNGGNATGNYNVNKVSALNVGDLHVAQSFATARGREARYRKSAGDVEEQVHRIVANGEAYIINSGKIDPSAQEKCMQAMNVLLRGGVSKYSAVAWEDRKYAWVVYKALSGYCKGQVVSKEDLDYCVEEFTKPGNLDYFSDSVLSDDERRKGVTKKEHIKKLAYQIAGAINAKILLSCQPTRTVAKYVHGGEQKIDEFNEMWKVETEKGDVDLPVSSAFISSCLSNLGIVGLKSEVISATLSEKIDTVFLFDMDRINTEKVVGDKQRCMLQEFDELKEVCAKFYDDKSYNAEWAKVLKGGSPKEILAHAKTKPEFEQLYNMSSGNWEGFTVGQHTESVLIWFDENYRDALPKEVEPFMKALILAHDVGKGYAHAHGVDQKQGNAIKSKDLFKDMGMSESLTTLASYIIGAGQSRTTDYYIYKDKNARKQMKKDVEEVYRRAFGHAPTEAEVEGVWKLCSILQNCDSASYSRRGTTRDDELGYFKNANDRFTKPFVRGKNGVKWELREPED